MDIEIARRQELFDDDLREPIRKAASRVIYGNFVGEGPYDPRPVGEFSSVRARYNRGWIETRYRTQRRYMEVGPKPETRSRAFDTLRNGLLLESLRRLDIAKPALRRVSTEARYAFAKQVDPLAHDAPGYQNLRGYVASAGGQRLTRQASSQARERRKVEPKSGKMRYGVQSGRLASAWRDSTVSSAARELSFTLNPVMGSTRGTPSAGKLTEYLSRNPGWRGLMDHSQLVRALEDQGVVVIG